MISLIFLLVLAWNFYVGYQRSIALQSFYTLGCVLASVIAYLFRDSLADAITLWVPFANATQDLTMAFFTDENIFDLSRVFYTGVAFLIIYAVVYLLVRFLGIFLHAFKGLMRIKDSSNRIISGALSVLVTFYTIGAIATVLATVPMTEVQDFLANNWFLRLTIMVFPSFLYR